MFPDYLWTMKATLDSYSFVIHERVSKDRVKVGYTTYLARVVSVHLMRIDIVNCTNISELKQVVYVYYLHQQSYADKEL